MPVSSLLWPIEGRIGRARRCMRWSDGPVRTTTICMDTRTVQVRIEGRVQGVGFRAFVEMNALELGLEGWVRNRRDGSVEAVFQGAADAVKTMLHRCQEGPPASSVARVEPIGEGVGVFSGFEVRPTV